VDAYRVDPWPGVDVAELEPKGRDSPALWKSEGGNGGKTKRCTKGLAKEKGGKER
jgi:hypothetical protein